MRLATYIAMLFAILLSACSSTHHGSSGQTWRISRTSDPVTGVNHCVVAAYDYFDDGGDLFSYSRTGYLYPFVENNSQFGVLVGVSSGGPIRLPVGDILWRVDNNPYWSLQAIDNPPDNNSLAAPYMPPSNSADQSMQNAMAEAHRVAQSITATATVASGARAQNMVAQMLSGSSLIFRAAAAAPSYGLPSPATANVGQYRNGELKPIPLDDSLRQGLTTCGIYPRTSEPTGRW